MKGKCINLDCPEYDKIVDIPDGEDFMCKNPECGHNLHEVTDNSSSKFKEIFDRFKLPLIIAAAVLAVAAAIVLFLTHGKGEDKTPFPPDPKGKCTLIDTVYIYKTDTVYIYKTDTVVPERETVSTKTYSFGKYVGSLKNGIPEGDGMMTYSRRIQIAKHDKDANLQPVVHYAEAGDKFVGSWGNGDIVYGVLYNKDGVIKEKILVSKRFNAYDISND